MTVVPLVEKGMLGFIFRILLLQFLSPHRRNHVLSNPMCFPVCALKSPINNDLLDNRALRKQNRNACMV